MRGVVTALLLLVGADRAAAQLCVGNSNFSLSHFHSSVDVDIDNLAHLYTAEFRYRYQHLFAGLEYGLKSWELTSLNGSSRAFAVTVGLSTQHAKSKVDLCPFLSYRSLAGPDQINGSVWRFDEKSYSAGLSAGVLAVRTRLWDVTPTATLTVATGNPKLTTAAGGNLAARRRLGIQRRNNADTGGQLADGRRGTDDIRHRGNISAGKGHLVPVPVLVPRVGLELR